MALRRDNLAIIALLSGLRGLIFLCSSGAGTDNGLREGKRWRHSRLFRIRTLLLKSCSTCSSSRVRLAGLAEEGWYLEARGIDRLAPVGVFTRGVKRPSVRSRLEGACGTSGLDFRLRDDGIFFIESV